MYFRYIGHGDNAKSALLYSRVNKLGHTGTIDKNDITSRTNVVFISNIENLSNDDASNELLKWLIRNYESLGIDNETIKNYIGNGNFVMQIEGIRNYLRRRS